MKTKSLVFLLLISGYTLVGQYTPIAPANLTTKNYSRHQIRAYLLATEPADAEAYALAKQSRRNTTYSTIWYTAGGLLVMGGISALATIDDLNNNGPGGYSEGLTKASLPFMATVNFCLGGIAIITGISQTAKARKRLNRAIELYHHKGVEP